MRWGREVGGLSNLLSAHRDLANPGIGPKWPPVGNPSVPDKPGKSGHRPVPRWKTGEIKAVWIACTSPGAIAAQPAGRALGPQAADYVVLQETCANTDTAAFADPAAGDRLGRETGTVTNSERRITHVHSAVPSPGEARHDWEIVVDFAVAWRSG